jgi:endonuclease/exonuclease/phosphatase family metal-dependent hydrolase
VEEVGMSVRFASFNVENLFERPKALNMMTWEDGQPILEAFAEFNALIQKANYTAADKDRMIRLLLDLEVYRRDDSGIVRRNRIPDPRWAWLRANRGTFDVEREDTGIEIVATGRDSWIGWLELATETMNETSVEMTARVITDVAADVLCVVEAESRPNLVRFNHDMLADRYDHVMLIDGNDTRGIDVGVMTSGQVEILSSRSNVDEPDPGAAGELLFSRDCAEYECRLPSGATVWVLLNHFKSQSGGGGGEKRRRQAQGVRDVVDDLVAGGAANVVVMGDLNNGPKALGQSAADLAPLYGPNSPLVDAYSLPAFDAGPRPGSWQSCGIRNRLDYIFVSQSIAGLVTGGGIERRGLWGTPTNVNPPQDWGVYAEVRSVHESASDHAAIFIDIDL